VDLGATINRAQIALATFQARQYHALPMNTHSRSFAALLILIAFAITAPIASAQKLDGQWFQLKLTAKGRTLNSDTGEIKKDNFSQPLYLRFIATGDPRDYNIQVWTLRDDGWTNAVTLESITLVGTNENFISDFSVTVNGASGNVVHLYHTVFLNNKLDDAGNVTSSTYEGAGEINSGTISGLKYFGGCSVKGKTIDASKLPFSPPPLVL
jgi:hypothetical protein